jgi:ATP-dependent DNA helicase RecG
MLHRVHFIEKWGRGIKLILSKEPDAEFSEVGTKFITTFKRRSYFEGKKGVEKGVEKTTQKTTQKKVVEGSEKGLVERLAEGLVERLAESQKRILKLIKENPYISKKELSETIGISTTAIDKNITRLKKEGLLKRIGPDKGGYWEVVRK